VNSPNRLLSRFINRALVFSLLLSIGVWTYLFLHNSSPPSQSARIRSNSRSVIFPKQPKPPQQGGEQNLAQSQENTPAIQPPLRPISSESQAFLKEPYHLRYAENSSNLVQVNVFYGTPILLDKQAAEYFGKMQQAAKNEGIGLQAVSGFRSYEDQRKLFDRQVQRRGSQRSAALLSAPPGFSEHHTGYAMDIGDVNNEKDILSLAFEQSKAFFWLNYGFEMSFPKGNPMGVSYEPWHWRFVGSTEAMKTFSAARGM
jgi:D-alanyl-D-alanine carboxypeptidase